MPNWCAGTLRFRGKKENVIKFLSEGFEIYIPQGHEANYQPKYICKMMERVKKEDLEDGYEVTVDLKDNGEYIYICDTRRAFIEWDPQLGLWTNQMWVEYYGEDKSVLSVEKEYMVCVLPVKQAWSFDYDNWVDISKKYEIDLHLFGWECGMGFDDELEIHNGEVIKNGGHTYDNWIWECPNPFVGG